MCCSGLAKVLQTSISLSLNKGLNLGKVGTKILKSIEYVNCFIHLARSIFYVFTGMCFIGEHKTLFSLVLHVFLFQKERLRYIKQSLALVL